mmetsp:Transcript_5997/g.23710  ORF Transcript_5997/g.23710 Transcript_5997/m.23710 type:complete len:266 (-) Transcript_5997:2192-2989(-)
MEQLSSPSLVSPPEPSSEHSSSRGSKPAQSSAPQATICVSMRSARLSVSPTSRRGSLGRAPAPGRESSNACASSSHRSAPFRVDSNSLSARRWDCSSALASPLSSCMASASVLAFSRRARRWAAPPLMSARLPGAQSHSLSACMGQAARPGQQLQPTADAKTNRLHTMHSCSSPSPAAAPPAVGASTRPRRRALPLLAAPLILAFSRAAAFRGSGAHPAWRTSLRASLSCLCTRSSSRATVSAASRGKSVGVTRFLRPGRERYRL